MAKAAILVPRELMAQQAKQLLTNSKYGSLTITEIRIVGTTRAVTDALQAVENGAEIIIARGLQATYIKQNTSIPVVEIVLTGQELALLVAKAKKTLGNPHPHIAFVGNVFSDMSHFEELFDIKLSLFQYNNLEQHIEMVSHAAHCGADIIIGGDMSNQQAAKMGIPSLFFESTEESIREALRIAQLTGYAMDVERRQTAQMENLLDSYVNGLILLDTQCNILKTNHIVEEMLAQPVAELEGAPLARVLPEIDIESIQRVIDSTTAVYHTTLKLAGGKATIWVTPVKKEQEVIGASLVCYGETNETKQNQLYKKNMQFGNYNARTNFRNIICASPKMKRLVDNAKLFALSSAPILIEGENGTEKEAIAQAIHLASMRSEAPFITLDCSLLDAVAQKALLFGGTAPKEEKGILEKSSFGTVYLHNIHALSMENQYHLFSALQTRVLGSSNVKPELTLDLRLIASTTQNLAQQMQAGAFCADLYYLLHALVLQIPPLRARPEDLQLQMKAAVEASASRHHRRITLTPDALQCIREYSWPGNATQINSFCERLVLSAPRQRVDRSIMLGLINLLYPQQPALGKSPAATNINTQAAQIEALLEKYHGNRKQVAQAMGISTTTLWRRMKQFGILDHKN